MLIFILSAPAVDTPESPDFPAPHVSDGALPESLRKRFRAQRLAERREELGLAPLRLVTAEEETVDHADGDEVWPMEDVLTLGALQPGPDEKWDDDQDDRDEDGDPITDPTPVLTADELEYANA